MRIFCDLHNSGLAYSLHLLLEKRLGHELYFPIGMQWAEDGYWQIHKPYNYNPETAKQYLQINPEYIPKDGTQIINKSVSVGVDHYEAYDIAHDYLRHHLTVDQFNNMPIDIVIASVPEHIITFKTLAEKKRAKFILQVGNIWWDKEIDFNQIPNLMSATIEYPVPASTNVVWYHEEFPLELFKPSNNPPKKQITSFINCLPQTGWVQDYYTLKAELPEYDFKSYGGSCDDGIIDKIEGISLEMDNSYFGFHAKKFGDGYGLIFHEWFASGKPILTHFSDYEDKLGGKLLIDMETAIDMDKHDINDIINILREIEPIKYQYMCQRAYEVFKANVNFYEDANSVKEFLNNLQ